MRLSYVELCGFRGYRARMRVEFAKKFTIIDGRNGVGKSTIFDAVEFALTGSLSKYGDAKASGETIADYLWWMGEGSPPTERYVEVGFVGDDDHEIEIRRTQLQREEPSSLGELTSALVDRQMAPQNPLAQLCSTSIIRDEHIAGLSLDLKETERYALLRDALGAIDADEWIDRAAALLAQAKKRVELSQQEVDQRNASLAAASLRIDQIRANLVDDAAVSAAVDRLRKFTGSLVPIDALSGPVRERIAATQTTIDNLQQLISRWSNVAALAEQIPRFLERAEEARQMRDTMKDLLDAARPADAGVPSSVVAKKAAAIINLVSLGREVGRHADGCPLCRTRLDEGAYLDGLRNAEAIARELDAVAAAAANEEARRRDLVLAMELAEASSLEAMRLHGEAVAEVASYAEAVGRVGLAAGAKDVQLAARKDELARSLREVQQDLRLVDTLKLSGELDKALRSEGEVRAAASKAQERLGRSLHAASTAHGLYDAARRAAAEALDQRLERVLPLMEELYERLRPHPFWHSIKYSVRGDVRRFLKLEVGDELNPQFIFSSGQRRATGLAFLLSINLSLAWSQWKSILMDDPVQHIDDFRTIHLAEVMAQLVESGRQVICAVEDPALADLLARRLPVGDGEDSKRVTIGPMVEDGVVTVGERWLAPFNRRVFGSGEQKVS